jgi:hypothetical protein
MSEDQRQLTMKVDSLRNWEKNPRAIKKDRFDELKVRIQRHGQFKPLIVTPDGEVYQLGRWVNCTQCGKKHHLT